MSQKNTSVGDVLTQLRGHEMQTEANFVKEAAKLKSIYAKKQTDLAKSTLAFEKKQAAQYELQLKDAKILAKKNAKSEVSVLNKTYAANLAKANKRVSKAKELVLKNLV